MNIISIDPLSFKKTVAIPRNKTAGQAERSEESIKPLSASQITAAYPSVAGQAWILRSNRKKRVGELVVKILILN